MDLKMSAKSVEDMETQMEGLKEIAAQAVVNMQVAMGSTALDLKGKDATELVELYASTQETFKSSFPVGGVSKGAQAEDTPKFVDEHSDALDAVGL